MLPSATSASQPVAAAATLLALGLALTADGAFAAEHLDSATRHAVPIADLAEQELWSNLARYGRYFVTVMLGTGYVMLRPLQAMLKRPVTAVFAIAALVALVLGTRTALEYMLGLNELGYDTSTFRIATEYGI